MAAIPLLNSNSKITSEEEAIALFNQNFDEIMKDTKEKVPEGKTVEEDLGSFNKTENTLKKLRC